jgi:hypothetical protein
VELTGGKTWHRSGGIHLASRSNDGELWFALVGIFQTGRRAASGRDGRRVQWWSSPRLLWGQRQEREVGRPLVIQGDVFRRRWAPICERLMGGSDGGY